MSHFKYNLLSLDPMYSPLHEKIAKLVAHKKYAVTSCFAKKVYLPSFKLTLATSLIKKSRSNQIDESLKRRVAQLPNYHQSYVKKIEGRELCASEIENMCFFYLGLKEYIRNHEINLVLIHNDTRWYHAIALEICRELSIKYLVTEQGLIRPYTTVIDNKGVNALANAKFDPQMNYSAPQEEVFTPTSRHDSYHSILVFFFFLSIFTFERVLNRRTVLPYLHNNYSIRKYTLRVVNKLKKKPYTPAHTIKGPFLLLLLQLEQDSQVLLYSEYKSNQEIITAVEAYAESKGLQLAIKKHPLDIKSYDARESSQWVYGCVKALSDAAKLVITVNSSAVVDVLQTETPLLLLGESLYNYQGIASKLVTGKPNAHDQTMIEPQIVCIESRRNFIRYLKNEYLTTGAGFSYDEQLLHKKVKTLLEA